MHSIQLLISKQFVTSKSNYALYHMILKRIKSWQMKLPFLIRNIHCLTNQSLKLAVKDIRQLNVCLNHPSLVSRMQVLQTNCTNHFQCAKWTILFHYVKLLFSLVVQQCFQVFLQECIKNWLQSWQSKSTRVMPLELPKLGWLFMTHLAERMLFSLVLPSLQVLLTIVNG
jgi:histone deacetylase complex regulatory component SIN3